MKKLLLITILFILSIQIANATLIAGYNFNDVLTNIGNGSGLDLTTTSGTGYVTDYPVYATSGNGTTKAYDIAGDTNKIPYDSALGGQLNLASSTISVWTKADVNSVTSDGYVFRLYSSGNDFVAVRREADDEDLYFMVRDASTFFADTKILAYDNNQSWIHIAMVLNSTNGCQVYIDAVEVLDDPTCKGLDDVVITDIVINGYSNSGLPLEGINDDFHVYDTELTTTQINNLYNYGNITAPSAPAGSSNKTTETLFKNAQTTNVTLNSVTYTTIQSYSFTPSASNKPFYQTYSIPVNPSASNTLTCKVQIDGVDASQEYSRTNTANQIGNLMVIGDIQTLTNTAHTIDLLCKRTGGGTMVLFDIIGASHELYDKVTNKTVTNTNKSFTNSTTSTTLRKIENKAHTTFVNDTFSPVEQSIILEWSGSITNNAGSSETIQIQPFIGTKDCKIVFRTIGSGNTGGVGGVCILENITNNTAYNIGFKGSGTSATFNFDYVIKEVELETENINNITINFDKTIETGWTHIANLTIEQDKGASDNIYVQAGLSINGTGGHVPFQYRLTGTSSKNSTIIKRYSNSNFGILGYHDVFENLATGNYTISLYADVTNLDNIDSDMVAYVVNDDSTASAENFIINATDFYLGTAINTFSIEVGNNQYTTTTGTINIPKNGIQNITYFKTGYTNQTYTNINTSTTSHTGQLQSTTTTITLNIYELWQTTLLSTSLIDIPFRNVTDDTNNPYTELASNYVNITNPCKNITVTATDSNLYYVGNTTTIEICNNDLEHNITLEPNKLRIAFEQNGVAHNTNGYIVDLFNSNASRAKLGFNSTPLLVVQQDLSNNRIVVQLNLHNGSFLENGTQWYEYDNDYTTYINETMEILADADETDSFYIQVQDYGQAVLEDVTIRAYTADVPSPSQYTDLDFFGQRITNEEGRTYFIVPPNQYIRLDITKQGYETKQVEFNTLYDSNPQDDPMIIYMREDEDSAFDSAFLYSDSNVFFNYTDTINIQIYSIGRTGIRFETDYTISQNKSKETMDRTIWGSKVPIYQTELTRGTHWVTNSNFTIYFYDALGNSLGNKTLTYASSPRSDIFDADQIETSIPNWVVLLLMIIISAFVGTRFNSPNAGASAFAISALIAGFIKPIFLVVTTIIAIYYIGRWLTEVLKE